MEAQTRNCHLHALDITTQKSTLTFGSSVIFIAWHSMLTYFHIFKIISQSHSVMQNYIACAIEN